MTELVALTGLGSDCLTGEPGKMVGDFKSLSEPKDETEVALDEASSSELVEMDDEAE